LQRLRKTNDQSKVKIVLAREKDKSPKPSSGDCVNRLHAFGEGTQITDGIKPLTLKPLPKVYLTIATNSDSMVRKVKSCLSHIV
jgi:hypothetical protein